MAQHDYNIANQSGADFRADLNNALLAIATVNSGATEPSTTFAHQLWVDTSSSVLKIRNAADNAWITTGVSITASNTFTGDLTGDVTGNLTGNVTGNVTGDLTGNADSADTLSTARTISLSGDVVGSVSFDGSTNVDIDTVVQINSITLGTDTTGDYVESMSGGTGVTVTGGTGEGSTPSIAIGQAVATTDDVTFNIITASEEFIGDLEGGIRFNAKADGALSKGDVVYISGVSGDVPTVAQAKADDASKMPAFGLALSDANDNAELQVVTFGTIEELDTSGVSEGQILYVSTTAGAYTTTAPTGESSQIQNIGKVIRSHAAEGSIKVGGAGRSNATPNLNDGKIFIGNASNQAVTSTLDTSIVVENTNLYYTTTRANTDFDTRLATKDTGDLTEGSNLYYTTARVNSDFDTRLATKDTGDLTEGSNLYYTDARVNSAFDTRLATKDTDDLTEGTTNLYYTSSRANTDFDTRLATKSTTDLAEGTNLYYTSARFDSAFTSKDTDDLSEGTTNLYYTITRFDSAFSNKTTADLTENTNLYYTDTRANSAIDTRVTKAFVDALGIQASSVDANSVTLGTDTVGNYIQTVTGTANKITVSGSGSESADITLSLPDDVQIASDLTVAGNLTVNGTLTSLDTTNLDIEDNLFQLNAGLTGSPVNDSGMLINRGDQDNGIFMWDESVDKFTLGLTTADGSATGNITLNSLGTLVANLEGNVTGAVTGTVSSLSNHDTGDLAEGSNLYYTQARFDSALAAKSTSDLSEGSNLYYTDARFDTRLATKDTDDVSEGTSNLYYTTARFDSAFGGKSTSDLSEGTNLYYTDARADARVNLQTGANLDLSSKSTSDLSEGSNLYYTSARANADFDTRLATKDTDDLSEGLSNLYYTDARVQAVSINNVVEDTTPQLGGNLASNGNDILFADNDKAIFGAGSDLQIYHDGSHSIITDQGTGSLLLRGTAGVFIQNAEGTENIIAASADGAVTLYYDNEAKLSTTSTGIDVTGTATMDGLTVDGTGDFNIGTENVGINITSTDAGAYIGLNDNNATGFYLGTTAANFYLLDTSNSPKLKINSNGDISFYDDTGTSQALYWDASAESLGIGTTSPSAKLEVKGSGTSPIVYFGNGVDNAPNRQLAFSGGSSGLVWDLDATGASSVGGQLTLSTNGTERMRIDSSGNVGIGTTSPSEKLQVDGNIRIGDTATGNNDDEEYSITSGGQLIISANDSAADVSYSGLILNAGKAGGAAASSSLVMIKTNDAEAMRIDSSGNVGIGGASGGASLQVNRASTSYIDIKSDNSLRMRMYGDSNQAILVSEGVPLIFKYGSTEAMRIDSSGNFLVGTTTPGGVGVTISKSANGSLIAMNQDYGNGYTQISFRYNGTQVGQIYSSISTTTYATSSDYRLKENINYDFTALDRVAQLKPARFNFIADADNTVDGFLAHEVQDIVPEAISGEKDAVREEEYEITPAVLDDDGNVVTEAEMGTREVPDYQGIDQSKLVPLLTKAIQEQQELINNLTARIEQLEN